MLPGAVREMADEASDTAPAPTFLTRREACDFLAASERTLRRWSAAGHVRAYATPGGSPRYALAELEALLRHGAPRPARGRPFAAPAGAVRAGSNPRREAREDSNLWPSTDQQSGNTQPNHRRIGPDSTLA